MPSYLSVYIHFVFATRDRAPMINERWREELHNYIGGTLNGIGAQSLGVGGVADHVHCLASMPSTLTISHVMREVKKSSSTWAAEHHYYKFGWQEGYAAFSVGKGEVDRIQHYIGNQEEHHRVRTSQDELRDLLAEHGIAWDEFYLK